MKDGMSNGSWPGQKPAGDSAGCLEGTTRGLIFAFGLTRPTEGADVGWRCVGGGPVGGLGTRPDCMARGCYRPRGQHAP